jgi:regulatory protein
MNYKITALKLQKRNRQRVNVYLDGEYAFGLARIVAAWLSVGQEIDDEKIAQLKHEDEREVAYQRAIKFLNYRPRTLLEIRQNLQKHDIPEEIIVYVLDRLQQAGLINDQHFAENWVENRSELRPRSRHALSFELKQRGIDPQVIEQTLEEIDDEELAYQAALKQARKYKNLEWIDFRRKMYGFLARRGFNYEVSSQATARVWARDHSRQQTDDILSNNEEVNS